MFINTYFSLIYLEFEDNQINFIGNTKQDIMSKIKLHVTHKSCENIGYKI